jgi:hypothetical protein
MRPAATLRIIKLGDFYLPNLTQQLDVLNSHGYCTIVVENGFLPIPEPDYTIGDFVSEYSFALLANTLDEVRRSGRAKTDDILVGIVNHSLHRNYFSMSTDDYRCVVASISDIEQLLGSVSLLEFLVLELSQYAVAAVEHHEWHREPRRCLYDFCGDKRDIANSLRYRSLCTSCEERLSERSKSFLSIAKETVNNVLSERRMQKVLFVSAHPSNESRLAIQREYRWIKQELQSSIARDRFTFDCHLAVRPSDLSRALLEVPRASILHFSGHGIKGSGNICLEDETGNSHSVSATAIAALLEPIASQLLCVILNACYSEHQAASILTHVPYVVAMTDAIGDDAAIAYSIGFYQAIFNGETIPVAHSLGCAQIQMMNQNQHHIPILLRSLGTSANKAVNPSGGSGVL